MKIILDDEANGWIYLPLSVCKKLKAPSAKEHISWIHIWNEGKFFYGRVLPWEQDYARVSDKFTCATVSKACDIKCYGKLPLSTEVTYKSSVKISACEVRLRLVNSIVAPGLEIRISEEHTIVIESVEPRSSDISLVSTRTLFKAVKDEEEEEVHVSTGLIEDPKTSLDRAYNRLFEIVAGPALHRDFLTAISTTGKPVALPKGLLLSGPPGCGKTFLVRRIIETLQVPLVSVHGPSIVSSVAGESEENLRNVFNDAKQKAAAHPLKAAIIFMDEIDAIGSKREDSLDQAAIRIVAQLLTLMDGITAKNDSDLHVVVIGATNRPNGIDPALRRPGRFDREIVIEPPSQIEREALLRKLFKSCPTIDYGQVAKWTIGYVPADLAALHREAVLAAVEEDRRPVVIETRHLKEALKLVGPSLIREYRVNVDPSITLDSIGGYERIKDRFEKRVLGPIRDPDTYAKFNLGPPRGILLHGPPGCSKTTFGKALANTAGCSFFSLNGASVYSAMVGEAERIVRETFVAARQTAPSILFVDELDALVGKRSVSGGVRDQVQERILSTFLNEMDGVSSTADDSRPVIVLGTTNRLDAIDSALLRPGRFDEIIEVPLPNAQERLSILQMLAKRTPLEAEINLEQVAERTEGFSGATVTNLIQEAAFVALRLDLTVVSKACIERILEKMGV